MEEEAEVEEVVEAVLVGGPGHLRFDECALGALQTRHVESCDPARKLCGRSYEGGEHFSGFGRKVGVQEGGGFSAVRGVRGRQRREYECNGGVVGEDMCR